MFHAVLNSNNLVGDVSGSGSNYEVSFPAGLKLPSRPDHTWYVALHRATYTNSIRNIQEKFNNNKFHYSVDGTEWTTIVFPDGYYQTDDISIYIQAVIKANGDNLPGDIPPIRINANRCTTRIVLYIDPTSGYSVKFEAGEDFRKLLGFDAGVYDVIYEADNANDLDRGIDNIHILCRSLLGNTMFRNGTNCPLLYSLPATGAPGQVLSYTPPTLSWVPIPDSDADMIHGMNILWTDPRGNAIDFNGKNTSVFLQFKQLPDE